MNVNLEGYKPLLMYTSPASIPQIVAHIQDYLINNPIVSIETIAQIIVQALQEHPELLNGSVIPISEDDEQSIKEYIDSLPLVDGYTKAEINLLLSGKQDTLTFDQTPTPGSSNPVTSSGIIAAMSALQTALETMINLKADAASTYTKTQVDTKLLDKANVSDVYTKNTMDAKLLEINTNIDGIENDIDGIQTDLSTQSQQIAGLGPINNLTSDSTTAALSAAQGKALKQQINDITAVTTGTIQSSLVTFQGETFLKKKNGNVGLELTFKPLEDIPAWTIFATIPEGFRPPKAIFSIDIYARGTNPIYQINPDGTIQAGFTMTASTQYRSVAIMWML